MAAHPLQPPETATCVQVRHGQLLAIDGPFAETSEQFGGFLLIEAYEHAEAIRLTAQIPPARFACVAVRPLH